MQDQNLLVVEDDLILRDSLAEFFKGQGFRLSLAASEDEAYQMALDVQPDVIISDHLLAKGSGLSLIQRVKQHAHQVDKVDPYCILITGQGNAETSLEAVQGRADDFLIKPLDLNHLMQAVGEGMLRRRRPLEDSRGQALNAFYHNTAAPMVVLHAYLDMLHEGRFGGLSEIQKDKLGIARGHLLDMMRHLSAFRRNEQLDALELEKSLVAVPELMRQSYGVFATDFERRGVNVFLAFAPSESRVWVARLMAEKVLHGLLGHWLMKAPAGAILRIRWTEQGEKPGIVFQLETALPMRNLDILPFDGALLQKAGMDLRSLEKGLGHQLVFLHGI